MKTVDKSWAVLVLAGWLALTGCATSSPEASGGYESAPAMAAPQGSMTMTKGKKRDLVGVLEKQREVILQLQAQRHALSPPGSEAVRAEPPVEIDDPDSFSVADLRVLIAKQEKLITLLRAANAR